MSRSPKITKGKLLRLLGVRELQTIVRSQDLEASDGRSVDALVRAVQRAHHVTLEPIVEVMRSLPEQRVKNIMEWLGLPSVGKRKHALLDGLLLHAADDAQADDEDPDGSDGDALTEEEQLLLDQVPEDGSSVGNARLRETLDWDEDDYWPIRDALVEKGYLAVGYGRGGSVYRLFEEEEEEEDSDDDAQQAQDGDEPGDDDPYPDEASLYDGVRDMLTKNWQQLFPGFPAPAKHWVDSSPRQGRRETGGRWTRPDLSAVTINKYRYVPGTHLDVFTFEVKPSDQLNILGLYEALGHSRRGNFAYVLYHVPVRDALTRVESEKYERELKEIIREATRLKVGVATFEDPAEAETWSVHVVPSRHDTEARLLDEFIENLPESIRRDIEFSIRG